MNRSFRAHESQMQASMRQRQQIGSLRTSMIKEKDEELALFFEMRRREKERNNLLLQNSDEFDAPLPLESRPGGSPIFNITSSTPTRKTVADDFLNSENDKNDYDWLLTPPGTPLFPSLEMEQKTVMSQIGTPKDRPTVLKSRLAHPQPEPEPGSRSNLGSRQRPSSPGLNTSSNGIRRPSSSGGPGSRSATPTGRPTLTSASKPTLTTVSKPTLTTALKPSLNSSCRPSRSSTPTSRATLTSNKPTVPARSTTPLSRTATRSSTPTARTTAPPVKSTSRTATPTRRPPTLSSVSNTSVPPVKSPSNSVIKSGPTTARNPIAPRASSPTMKPRPWKPSEMPGFSLDAPPNLKTSLSERPNSAARGRPGVPGARSSSVEAGSTGRVRRQSCSPSRGRLANGIGHSSGSSVPANAMSRLYSKANDNISPVLVGTKMVERVINMRKLAPPKQDDKHSPHSNLSGKSSSPDSSGFGRTLSKKSLDMAIRHMDIRRSIPGNLRPLMSNIPASSMYSVRSSGPTRSKTVSVSDSPIATSSNASSEINVNNNGICLDLGIEVEDDINSERVVLLRSPGNVQGRSALVQLWSENSNYPSIISGPPKL